MRWYLFSLISVLLLSSCVPAGNPLQIPFFHERLSASPNTVRITATLGPTTNIQSEFYMMLLSSTKPCKTVFDSRNEPGLALLCETPGEIVIETRGRVYVSTNLPFFQFTPTYTISTTPTDALIQP